MEKIALYVPDEKLRAAVDAALAAQGLADRAMTVADEDAAILAAPDGVFRMGALLDRVRAARAAEPGAPVAFGPYVLAAREGVLRHADGSTTRLTEKERAIITTLHALRGAAIERSALLAAVWGYGDAIETHTLETHIYRLRQKIENDPAAPEYLITDEEGYRLRGL